MTLSELVSRTVPSQHWNGPYKIPWNQADFSRRLLDEHLDQSHDAASRRLPIIDRQVHWIHNKVVGKNSCRVIDLCCGPGLYTSRLARLGHTCVGIDFAPVSLSYARTEAADAELDCEYVQADVREVEYGSGYGLSMMLFGEFNTFPPIEMAAILRKMWDCLDSGGRLLVEPQRFDSVQRAGAEPANWYRAEEDLFADQPHICLEEHFWDESARIATDRYYAIDAETADVTEYVGTRQAYSQAELVEIVRAAGFSMVECHRSLTGDEEDEDIDLMVVLARKP